MRSSDHAVLPGAQVEAIAVAEEVGQVIGLGYELLDIRSVARLDDMLKGPLDRMEETVGVVEAAGLQRLLRWRSRSARSSACGRARARARVRTGGESTTAITARTMGC